MILVLILEKELFGECVTFFVSMGCRILENVLHFIIIFCSMTMCHISVMFETCLSIELLFE